MNFNSALSGVGNKDPAPNGVTGETTTNMQTMNTFVLAGWDFINVWNIGENQTYPFLRKYLAGDINYDGKTDFMDFAILAENWLLGL